MIPYEPIQISIKKDINLNKKKKRKNEWKILNRVEKTTIQNEWWETIEDKDHKKKSITKNMNAQKPVSGGHTSLFVGNLDPSVTDVNGW